MSTRGVFPANNCPTSASTVVVPDSAVHQRLPAPGGAEAARSNSPIRRQSCCERLCAAVTKCCGRIRPSNRPRNKINSEENNDANDNPPAMRDPIIDSVPAKSIEGDDFANVNNVVENIASPRRKSWLRKIILPSCYRSKEPKRSRIELAVCPVSASLPNSGVELRGEESHQELTEEGGQKIEGSGTSPETPGNEKQRSEEGSEEAPSTDPGAISDPEIAKNENCGRGEGLVFGPHKDGGFFLNLLEIEEKRLQSRMMVASRRLEILENGCEEAGEIRIAIGKGNLLISKKFKQFRELCQTNLDQQSGATIPESDAGATLNEDLEGFWDVVLIQVQLIDDLFNKTEASPTKNEITVQKKRLRKPVTFSNTKPSPVKKSELTNARDDSRRRMLAEKRAAMKFLKENQPIPQEVVGFLSEPRNSEIETPLEGELDDKEMKEEEEIDLTCYDVAKELQKYLGIRIGEIEDRINEISLAEVGMHSWEVFQKILNDMDELESDYSIFKPYICKDEKSVKEAIETPKLEGELDDKEMKEEEEIDMACYDIAQELQMYLDIRLDEIEARTNEISLAEVGTLSPEVFDKILNDLDELESDYYTFSSYICEADET